MGIFWNVYFRYYDVGDDGWVVIKFINDVLVFIGIVGFGLFFY